MGSTTAADRASLRLRHGRPYDLFTWFTCNLRPLTIVTFTTALFGLAFWSSVWERGIL